MFTSLEAKTLFQFVNIPHKNIPIEYPTAMIIAAIVIPFGKVTSAFSV